MQETIPIIYFVFAGGILLICLVGFIAWLWAIIETIRSKESDGTKIAWILLLIFIPLVGLIIWLFVGPRAGRSEGAIES